MLDLCYRWIPLKYEHRKRKLMVATGCSPNANQLNAVRDDQTKPAARGIRHVAEICSRSRIHAADYQIITLRNTHQRILCLDSALCSFFGTRYIFFF